MEFNNFLNYISANLKQIYANFNSHFGVNQVEFEHILKKLIDDVATDKFYRKLLNKKDLSNCFESQTLYELKKYLSLQLRINDDDIKNILINTPEILFFATNISKIYPIFKGSYFKGYVLLDDDLYKAYSFYNNYKYLLNSSKASQNFDLSLQNIKINYVNPKFIEKTGKYVLVKNDLFDNSKLINYLLENLNREDVMKYYGLTSDSTLEEKFDAISTEYNKRDYYFKRKK